MKTPYSYSVLRYVHDITTGEFVNAGVVIYSPVARYAGALCRSNSSRFNTMFPGVDHDSFKALMRHIQSRVEQVHDRLQNDLPLEIIPDSIKDIAHSILTPDDSSLQWSHLGSGISDNLPKTLNSLYQRLVSRYDKGTRKEWRNDDDVWRKYSRNLASNHVLKRLEPTKITVEDDAVEFKHAWKNGIWHCLQPVSLDLSSEDSIREKVYRWAGQVMSVNEASDKFKVYFLLGEPKGNKLNSAINRAISILNKAPGNHEIVRENEASIFTERFARKMSEHYQNFNP